MASPGQPSKFKPKYSEMVIDHMAKGYSFESFAAVCDVCVDTLYEWASVHPAFSEAKKRAFAKCRLEWESMGIDGAKGQIQNFNAGAWVFNMKNRFKWSDRMETKVELEDVTNRTRDELILEAKQLIKELAE